jgi:membrane protein required for colicin V production
MSYLDIIIIILLVISAISGFRKGLIHQLASLLALIFGIYLAIKFSHFAASFIQLHFTSSANTAKIIAFVVVFIVVVILVHLLGKFLEKTFEEIELGSINKIAGCLFSVAKSVFIISCLMLVLKLSIVNFNWPKQADIDKSFSYKPIESAAPAVFPYLKQLSGSDVKK